MRTNKEFSGIYKTVTAGIADKLRLVNTFTRREFREDELILGRMRLANNAIDRDNERFSEEILESFARTVVRKTLLFDHDRRLSSAIGKFFDVEIERIPLDKAVAETGEPLILPAGVREVVFLSPWFYIPRAGLEPGVLAKIEGGVCDFVSIGFRAEALVPVFDDMGEKLYDEYRGKGEVTEGSIVYLGAQYGASLSKAAGEASRNGSGRPADMTDPAQNPLIPRTDEEEREAFRKRMKEARSKNPLIPENENNA